MYVPILSSRMVTSSTIFGGNNMAMCLIADTPFPKAWTTLWMVTICIASMERVDVEVVYDLTTEQCQKVISLLLRNMRHFKAWAQFLPCSFLTPCHAIKLLCSNLISIIS